MIIVWINITSSPTVCFLFTTFQHRFFWYSTIKRIKQQLWKQGKRLHTTTSTKSLPFYLTTAKRKVKNRNGPKRLKKWQPNSCISHLSKENLCYLPCLSFLSSRIMAAPVLNMLAVLQYELKQNIICYNPPQLINFLISSYKTRIAAAPVLLNMLEHAPR